jgi:biopolymer transport protein ExbD
MSIKKKRMGSDDPDIMMDINTTPLIDVMLVLLVMLIITIPIQLHAVNLEMPVSSNAPQTVAPEKINLIIDERSAISWDGVVINAAELEQRMAYAASLPNQPEIHLRPHKDCQYAVFANVLSSSKRKGLSKIAVIGAEQFVQ